MYRNTLGVIVAVGGGGMALEAGGYIWLTEEAAPFVSRVSVRGWQLVRPGLQAYGKHIWKRMVARVGADFSIQMTSGFLMGDSSALERTRQAGANLNGSSLVLSAVLNTNGVSLSSLSKWVVATGSVAASNLVTVSGDNKDKYGSYLHGVDFHDKDQTKGFAFNVVLGALLDRGRDGLVAKWGEGVAARASTVSQPLVRASLR